MGKKKSLGEIADAIQEEQTTAPVRPSLADVADGITDGATAAPEVPAGSDPFAQPPAQGAFSPDPDSRTGSASPADAWQNWPDELPPHSREQQAPVGRDTGRPQGDWQPRIPSKFAIKQYGLPKEEDLEVDPAMGIRPGEALTGERKTDLMASPQAREAMKDYKAYATTYGDLDLPGVERARGTLAKTKERLTGLVESFRTDTENLDSQTDSLIALRKQAEDAVAQERPEANQLLADFNQRRDRYNAMSEALQKKADALYDLDEVVRRNERHLARREYDIKADTGGPLGAFYNSTLRGAGKVRAGIRGYAIDAIIAMAPESSLNGMSKNDAARTFKKMMLPVDREFFVDRLGTESTTNEYIDKVHDKNLVGSALLSVAETLPAIGAPYGIGLFLQSSDQAAQEMEAPEFDGVPEWKKRLFSTAYGATIGRLEHVGLKNVASRTPLVKQMFARAIKEVPADASAETIKRTLADRVVDMAKAYSKDVALGSVSEFETGGLQSMAENALKEAFNEAEGKKLFKHAEGWTGYIEDALVEGAAEAIGGAFFAQPFAVQSAMNAKGLGATATNEQYENLEKMFTDDLYRGSFEAMVKQQVDASKISQAKANEVVEAWKEASSIAAKVPGGLSTEKRREAFDLLREKAQLSKQDKAMVGDKITVINEKLAALAGVSAPNQGENAKPEKGSNSDRDVKQATGASEAGDQRSSTAVPGLDTEGGAGTNDGGATPEPVQGVLSDTGDAGVQDEVPAADPVPEVGVPAEAPGEGDGIEKPYLTKDGKHRVTYDPETQQAEVEPLAPKPHISQWEHLSPANARRAKRKAMQAYSQAKSRARKEFAKATGQKVAPASNTLKEAGQDNKAITKQANNYSSPELGVYGTALRYFATGGKMSAAKGKTRAHMGWGDGSEITSQEKIAGWLLDDNAPSVEDVAHSIWENWPEGDVDSRPDTSEILDAVIEVAGKFENATGALGSLKDYFPEVDTDTQQRYDQEWAAAEQQRIMEEDLARGETKLDNMSDAEYEQLVAETEESEKAVHSQNDAVPQESQAPDRQAAEQTGSAPGEEGAGQKGGKDPEAERLRGEVARARQARSNFIADFNDRGSALFDEQEGNLQTSIDGGFDNSQENYNERLAEYDAAVTAAERALADHEKASRPDPNQTSLEDAAEGPKKPAKKASFARTEDQKEEVRKRMAERLKRLGKGGNLTSSGISPRDMEDLVGLVGDVVELGYHKLKDVIEQIKAMVDDRLFPHITEAYRKFRDTFEQDAEVRYSLETDAEIEAETGSGGQRQGDVRGRERVRPSGQPSGARPAIRIANQEALPVPERQYVVDGDYPIDEHQRLGVNLALNYFRKPGNEGRAFLLADGAGVGKTREILATADMVRKDTGKPVMIVSLRGALDDSFKKDAKAMGIDLSNFETGTYDDLNAGKVGKGEYALVIYDESHNLKNPLSGRSTASKRVKTANTMFTSATPFDKSEFAIRFMSDITGKTNEEVENELGVEIEIVEDRYGNIRPMAKYPFGFMTYLERLVAMRNQVIADGGMIRREYPFYGTVQEMDAGAMPAELQSEVAKVEEIASKREEAAENLVKAKWASERARVMGTNFNKEWKWVDDGVRSGKLQEEYGRRYRDFIRDERRQSLDAIDKLTEPHKVDVAIKEAKKAIANGEQVIMVVEGVGDRTAKMGSEKSKYGYFERKVTPATESLKKAMDAAGISYALIAGGNRSGSYQKEQDRFNKGEAQVLIMTAKSGGTGINLDDTVGDAPRRMIMLTPPYGGDTFEQAIGRVSRRNTASPSTVQTMRFQGNRSDDNRAEKVAMKRSVIDAVVIGDDLDMRRLEQNAPPEAMAQLSPKSGSQAALRNDARDLVDGWYSRLHESVAAKGRTQPASEWKNWIAARAKEGAFSLEEAKWTGLSDWLASKGKEKVTPQQVREFLKENRVKVEVVEKSDNYSEDDVVGIEDEDDNGTALRVVFSDGTSQIVDYISDAEYAAQKEKRDKAWDEMQRIRVEYDALRGGMPTAEWNEANPDKAAALKEEFEKHRSIVSLFDNPPVRFAQGKEAAIREAVYNANEASVPVAGGDPQFSEYQLPGGPLARDTEILTRTGWKRIDAVAVGEDVLTRIDESGILEWNPVEAKPEVFAEKLYHFFNQSIDMRVTPCHKMVVKRRRRSSGKIMRVTAKELWDMSECLVPLTGKWEAPAMENLFGLPANDVAELVGWYVAEGSAVTDRNGKKSTLGISQSRSANPDKCNRLEALFGRLGIKWNYVDSGPCYYLSIRSMPRGLVDIFHAQGTSEFKHVPRLFMDAPQDVMRSLLEGLILGDGHTRTTTGRKEQRLFFSKSKQLADDVQVLALMTGYRAAVRQRPSGLYVVGFNHKKWAGIDDAKHAVVDYNDIAYCVTVKNHAIYVRTNGVAAFTGNSNYREVLVTLPSAEGSSLTESTGDAAMRVLGKPWSDLTDEERTTVLDNMRERAKSATPDKVFRSSHFDEPNILVHLRLNDRTGPNGEKILFIEELQSDWGQQGKKKGFKQKRQDGTEGWTASFEENKFAPGGGWWTVKLPNGDYGNSIGANQASSAEEAIRIIHEKMLDRPGWETNANDQKTSPAPFVTSTEGWVELGLKQAIRMAVDGGYDRVAWTTGEQQNERYDLSKQVDRISWQERRLDGKPVTVEMKGSASAAPAEFIVDDNGIVRQVNYVYREKLDGKRLDEVVGKDVADKIMSEESGDLSGDGLKIGGSGMKGFYDKILPAMAGKVSKKLGGDGLVGSTKVDGAQQSITITPEMRAKVLQGVPLMQGNLKGEIKDPGLKGSVEAVAKALSTIAPNVKIVAHADPLKFFSEAYLVGATGDGNSSVTAFYNASANEIHINAQDAKSTTLFHEAAHPVLAAAIQNNPELVNSLYNELAGRPDFAKYKKFGQQYEGENLQKVEALVEFMADVAAGNVTQAANPNSLWQKVKAWLNDVLSKIGFGPKDIKLDPSSLRAFADGFAKAMRDGIRINGDKLRADMTVAEQRRAAEFTPDEIAGNIKAKGLSKAEAEAFMKQKGMSQSKIDAVLKAYDGAQQGQFAFINPPMPPGEVQDAFEKQEAEAKKHRLSFGKRLYRSYIQKFEDKKGVAKDLLSQAGAAEAVIRLNLVSGAGGAAKAKFTKYHAQVHGDLNTTEKSVLNNIIQARRIINLDEKYDGITAPKKQHPYGMTGESVQTWLNDLAVKHPELHSKLMGRADAYFKAMGEMLEMKHKEGIISDELYDKLKNDEYSPREFVHHLVDAEERMVIGTTDVSRTGIKRLLDGSNEALFNNSEWLLANQVASTHKLVFNNRANKALYKWAVTEGDPEVAYPLQEGEEPRSGFQAISHFAGGHMIKVAVRNEIATPWLQSDAALRPDLANAIRVVTGGSLFRVMVTGANLTFAFRNFPRDVGHVLMFTNTYSNMLPRALAEMGLDLAKVSGDAFKRKGRYQEYMEEGGSMDFLTRQGRPLTSKESIFSKDGLLRRKTIAERGLDGFMHFAGYINETSEIVVRLAVREREISKLTDAFVLEKGREPDASELKWIKEQATAKAREYMDFNQGGEWAKAVDSAIPYLNAGFQGTRVMARYIKTNPKVFAWKMAQLSALTAMIMAHNLGHEDEWEEIPDEIKENNFVILIPRWTRMDKDGRKRTRYFTIPKTHDQRIFSSFVESIMEYVVLGKYPTKRSMIALKQATPFDPKRFMDVPLINAMNSYASGYDTYRDRNVFPRKDDVEDWAEYTQRTPGIYKDVARWTSTIDENGKMVGGLSPERSKLFVEKYAGLSENNMFFMLTNKAWEMGRGAFGGQSEEFDKSMIEHLNDVALPFYGSFIRETNPRSADEAFERHSRLEATRRHVESVAVKELVGKYNAASTDEQKNAVKKEAVDQINSFASEDRKRAIENFKNGILLKDVPYMYVAMKTEPMAVRVNTFAEAYRVATDREKEKMLEYANRVKLFTPELLKELKKKMAELDTMEKKGAEK